MGGEPQCWSEGHCLLVDDSFLHTVCHKGWWTTCNLTGVFQQQQIYFLKLNTIFFKCPLTSDFWCFLPSNMEFFSPPRACRCWTSGRTECWPLASECGCSRETSPGLHVQPWPLTTVLRCLTRTLPVVAGYGSLCENQYDRSHKQLARLTATYPEFPNWHHPKVKWEPMAWKENQCKMGDWLCWLCLLVVFCMWNPSCPVTRFCDEKLMHADKCLKAGWLGMECVT